MNLLICLISTLNLWRGAFCKEQAFQRAKNHALASLCSLGRGTISNLIIFLGKSQKDHTADYHLYSNCKWKVEELFNPILEKCCSYTKQGMIAIAVDDSRYRKTGKKIPNTSWHRDPMGPKFQANLVWGCRFLQFSYLMPLYNGKNPDTPPRALPVRFLHAPPLKKPGKKATPEQLAQYKKESAKNNLSTLCVQEIKKLREDLDLQGNYHRKQLIVADGSFANKTCFNLGVSRTEILARTRKNTKLCFRAQLGGRRIYDAHKFSPESVRQNEEINWSAHMFFFGGERRKIYYKEVKNVLWQSATKTKPLRLIVLRPLPYIKGGKRNYRQPAYLLTTDLEENVIELIQYYLDRWQIEVNFKEEKSLLKVGQSQVRNEQSVKKRPALQVAAYAALMLASIEANHDQEIDDESLPAWRKKAKRPSTRNLIGRLREELLRNPDIIYDFDLSRDVIVSILKHAA